MLNTKKHITLLLSIVYCLLSIAFSQTITPTFIGTSGNYSAAPFGSVSSSVGEPMTTTLGPVAATISYLTQGFQQPEPFNTCSLSVSISSSITNYIWAERFGGTNNDNGNSVTADALGNIYITGAFQGANVDFDPGPGIYNLSSAGGSWDVFVLKLGPAGNLLWAKNMGGMNPDDGKSITLDNNGNVYVTGIFQGTADLDPGPSVVSFSSFGNYDIFIVKLDPAGNLIWARQMGGNSEDQARDIKVDAAGNVYTTGWFSSMADFDPGLGMVYLTSNGFEDIFISKLDGSGDFLWAKQIGGTFNDYGYSIALDAAGNVHTTGIFQGTNVDFDPGGGTFPLNSAGSSDIFISKLTASGNFMWAKQMGTTGADGGYSITVDAIGNVYATGYMNVAGNDIFVSRITAAGNILWTKQMGGTSTDEGLSIALDAAGNVYTTGRFEGTADLDPSGAGIFNLISSGFADIFISSLDNTGNFLWAKQMGGGTGADVGRSIALDASGNVFTTGSFQGTNSDFDPGPGTFNLSSAGLQDIFVSKLGAAICSGESVTLTANAINGTMPYIYSWSPAIGLSCTTCQSVVATPSFTITYTVAVLDAALCMDSATVTVTVNPSPTVTVTSFTTTICAGSSTTLTANGASSYVWSPSSGLSCASCSSPAASPPVTMIYTVTGTNAAGCTGMTTVTVTVNAPPIVNLGQDVTQCGGTVTLNAGNTGSTYLWSDSSTNSTLVVTTSGTYSVIVTAANGCTGSDIINVVLYPALALSASASPAACTSPTGTATVIVTGNPPYSYLWNPTGQTTSTATGLAAGNYTVTVTDSAGCVSSAAVTVPTVPGPTVSISSTSNPVCLGSGTMLTATTTGGIPVFTYQWSSGQSASSIFVIPTGSTSYSVLVTDGNGCTGTDLFTVTVNNPPIAGISGNTSICAGQQTTLTGTGGNTYSWSTSATTTSITVSAGTYSVFVTDINGCKDTASITVNVYAPPVASISIASGDTNLCSWDTDSLLAFGGSAVSTYFWWNNGASTSSIGIQPVNSGSSPISVTYTVTVSDGGCSDTATFTITVNPLPTIVAVVDTPDWTNTICKGDVAWLLASGGDYYYWVNNGLTDNPVAVSPTVTTTYTVLGTNQYGCVNAGGVTVAVSEIFADAGEEQTICPGFTAQLRVDVTGDVAGGLTYYWFPADSTLSANDVPNPSATPDSTTVYWVEAFNQYGCWAKDTVKIFVIRSAECEIHVYNGITPNGDGANDVWWIDGIVSFPENKVWIFNRWGAQVWHGKNYDNRKVVWKGTNEQDQPLPDGTYYYIIELYDKDGAVLYSAKSWVEITR